MEQAGRKRRRGRRRAGRLGLAALATPLLACTLTLVVLAAVSAVLLSKPAGPVATLVANDLLPLTCFLLVMLLAQARYRIWRLERERSTASDTKSIDPLTSLPDRLYFERALEAAIGRSNVDRPVALITIDVDRFKNVNDTHGHGAGDRLLVGIVERIRRVVREGDCFVRLGGDEFALVLPQIGNDASCASMAHRILDSMIAPFDLGNTQIFATLSLGIAIGPQDGESPATLCQAADLALYRAKHEGRNRFTFFDKSMEQKRHLGQTIEDDLRAAITGNELTVAYQPLIRTRDGLMQGVEALVRWEHPKLGMIPPEDFIPLAESRGLIVPLGEWVLKRACLDAKRWPMLRIAVNVSPVQFRQRGFVDQVGAVLAATGIDPTRLDLELTEGVLIQDAEQAETVIMELRALGIRMGLDDFGSGYSSMIYLRRFAFDKVKIDRAFMQSFETSGEGAIILEYIVSLGHALGLSVTAEGIEQSEQVEFLKKLGCDELQGYYFAPPLPAHEIDERVSLAAWTISPSEPAVVDGRDAA